MYFHSKNVFYSLFVSCFRGVLLQRQNRLTEALEWYTNAIQFRPKLVRKFFLLLLVSRRIDLNNRTLGMSFFLLGQS